MDNILQQIVAERRADAAAETAATPFEDLQRRVATMAPRRGLRERLMAVRPGGPPCLIAEIKRASPSAGMLRPDDDAAARARVYADAGAGAISVVTEPRHFHGRDQDVRRARLATRLPVLRKDFISDPYQVYQTAALGADVMLLIAAVLDFGLMRDLYIIAMAVGLEVLAEVHTPEELEMVLPLAGAIIGVNTRDLKTMRTDLNVAREMAGLMPADRPAVAESGIKTRRDVRELQDLGYRGFLIGEVLMRSEQPAVLLRTLAQDKN